MNSSLLFQLRQPGWLTSSFDIEYAQGFMLWWCSLDSYMKMEDWCLVWMNVWRRESYPESGWWSSAAPPVGSWKYITNCIPCGSVQKFSRILIKNCIDSERQELVQQDWRAGRLDAKFRVCGIGSRSMGNEELWEIYHREALRALTESLGRGTTVEDLPEWCLTRLFPAMMRKRSLPAVSERKFGEDVCRE